MHCSSASPRSAKRIGGAQFNDCGNNHFDNDEYEEALSHYGSALAILPEYGWAFCNRGALRLATGDTAAAIADYTRAIEIDSHDAAARNGRAFSRLRRHCDQSSAPAAGGAEPPPELEAALRDVGEALALESTAAAHCTKGAILQQLALAKGPDEVSAVPADGEWARLVDAAIAEQRRAMELEPSAQEPREYLKALLRLRGIDESVPDAADSYRPAPQPAAAAATAGSGSHGRYPEGWLHEKGGLKDGERNWIKGGRRNWKVRWFSFDGSTIRWFESKGGKELGNLAVGPQCAVEIDEENRNKFCVRSERRDLWCKADDESQAVEWCVCLCLRGFELLWPRL